ncbi:hypothetical protein KHQ06_24515 [Nocardia tengchongensis]|uniref:DUF222 domain-containing protein n=1 Tax=Nocardia tengchongensis TaxID=2055889 RepID=A0ABX8CHT5_9NOCA|nr:hypothetical protein [Nocardia tengchongensis]QVI19526.1 hypothetical protein KHQ06_24515 [Nocardia tengchongensis]
MTEPHRAAGARNIPADQVGLLQRIQALALRSGQLLQQMYESGGDARTSVQAITEINAVDRDRDLTEIKARAAGVPDEWVDRVRTLGQRGYPWREDQPLPDPAPRARRSTIRRVADDVEQLKDMAAVHATYLHTRPVDDPVSDMEQAVTQQLRRNMAALWMRAGRTAESIGMSTRERAVLWAVTPREWQQRIAHYLVDKDLGELHTRWRGHGDPAIANAARKSLGRLRRAGEHGPEVPLPDMPMPPQQMLNEAHTAFADPDFPDNAHSAAISAAVEAALPDEAPSLEWTAEDPPLSGTSGPQNEHRAESELEP